jgi:inosine-uridine nucleoside N-ribohydrolase
MNRFTRYYSAFIITLLLLFSVETVSAEHAVWIDADPACGHRTTDDVDDCWALLLALNSKELDVRGISTLYGNVGANDSYAAMLYLSRKFEFVSPSPAIYRGAEKPLNRRKPKFNSASSALAEALESDYLTLIALGPLTNIATLILDHPESLAHIKQVIAVAGQRPEPGLGFYPGKSRLLHMHDFNFRKDVESFEVLLRSSLQITLVPFEVAKKISIKRDDLVMLEKGNEESQWLSKISMPWLEFWKTSLKSEGFHPFDSLAVGYLIWPELFTCEKIPVEIQRIPSFFTTSRDRLLVSQEFDEKRYVEYCHDIKQEFKQSMFGRFQ